MNAPTTPRQPFALERTTLDDKYTLHEGRAFMSGVQALVRLPLLQRQRDALAGLDTAGFISGYRGSPLGGYDQALWQARAHLQAQHIVFQPGVNEELAATAVWGTQMLDLQPQARRHDGVFGLWYGKGPGVDRCSDVFKHANLAGTTQHGGVLAVAGDDHVAKSSTAAHQSDPIFIACGLPVFFPSSVQDILDMGVHAIAMSRHAGVWVGMKTIQEVVESAASVDVSAQRVRVVLPPAPAAASGGVHMRWPDGALEQEARLIDVKWPAVLAYVRANRLNHDVIAGPQDRFGLIASGKAFNDTRQALADLGLDDAACQALGIRLHKVNVVWPLEPTLAREFAAGLREVLVVEEKRALIEAQLKEQCYAWPASQRPAIAGKFEPGRGDAAAAPAAPLLRAQADLSPALIARALARRLRAAGIVAEGSAAAQRIHAHLQALDAAERMLAAAAPAGVERTPWFCSGCPHNTSTRVPEGSRALAGIGCHFMALWMGRSTTTFSQMGGEGVSWVGQAPFTTEPHVFANLGDGTYYHSGLLAVRQSIAAGVNITYKILYNDAVAMTGGQPVDGILRVPEMTRELDAEGVRQIVIVTDEPDKYAGAVGLAHGVTVHHRDALDAVQRTLRSVPGCTALIYDQTCATEKRRRRKRGTLAAAPQRVVINEWVCEGCGDCSVQSNCLSVEPVDTPLGRKRRIHQGTCNQDLSCVKGFCPSFVTVSGGTLKPPSRDAPADLAAQPPLPLPTPPALGDGRAWRIVVGGVGGTGVITLGQLLGMAAHLDGLAVVTQDSGGLAQKGGATWAHVQIAAQPQALCTTKVDTAQADLVIGCDPIVAAHPATLAVMRPAHTVVALNRHGTPTAAVMRDADWRFPEQACDAALERAVGAGRIGAFDAEQAAVQWLGDSLYTNPLLLGYAWQRGWVPLSHAALMRAIALNGVQVQRNQAAFEWGRHAAHDPARLHALAAARQVIQIVRPPALDDAVATRADFLAGYQNAAYAQRYRDAVARVRAAEQALGGASHALTHAVARSLFQLMAYKDEYEVARLHTLPAFTERIGAMFDGEVTLTHHLAPPLLARRNARGELVKRAWGPWVRPAFTLLARLKGLRGTAFDIFGHTEERRAERRLIADYFACLDELLPTLDAGNLALAAQIARLPQDIRGFGHVKARNFDAVREQWAALMAQWRGAAPGGRAGVMPNAAAAPPSPRA